MDLTSYENKGLSGLANLGNTCYINSCMQILSHTYELNNFLEKGEYKNKLNRKADSLLLIEWDNLRQMMWNKNCIISPGKFIKTVQNISKYKNNDMFVGFAQNDVSEFLLFIVNCFHTALSREIKITVSGKIENDTDALAKKCFEMIQQMYTKDYSEIWNIFYAIQVSNIKRVDNDKILSQNPESYFVINLPIPPNNKKPSLLDCFDKYIESELIENYADETTNEEVAINKNIMFWSFPNILTIDLKRFNGIYKKNNICIDFPINDLDLSKYVVGYNKNKFIYDLYGICNHSGGLSGGHYTSYVKNANGKWYHFNDTTITEINESNLVSSNAYVLFYRKKTIK